MKKDELKKEEINKNCKFDKKNKKVTLITGKITEKFINEKAIELMGMLPNLNINVISVENEYFGKEITVTGLVVGRDIINTIKNLKKDKYDFGQYIVIPEVMLKDDEDIFLDDTTLECLQKEIDINIVVSDTNAKGLVNAIISDIPDEKIYKFNKNSNRQSYENSINH